MKKTLLSLVVLAAALPASAKNLYCVSDSPGSPYVVELAGRDAYFGSEKGQRTEILAQLKCRPANGRMEDGSSVLLDCSATAGKPYALMFTRAGRSERVIVFSTESESDLVPMMSLNCSK